MKKTMRVSIFIMLILLLSGNNLWAKFGIKVGATLSFAGEESAIYNASNLIAAKAGLFYSFTISKSLSIQPEIYFAMKGGKYYSVHWRATDSVHLNYLEIPVLINVSLVKEKFDLFLGPYVSLLIGNTEIDDEHDWTWIENEVKDNDFGVSLGARYHVIRAVFVGIQFNNGLTKVIYDPNPVPQSFNRVHKNKTLSLLVGFNF